MNGATRLITRGGVRWRVANGFGDSPLFDEIASLDPAWRPRRTDARSERRRRWSTVYRSGQAQVFLKYYLPRSRFERVKYLLRPTRASAEWRNAQALERIGIHVPKVLAWGERRGMTGWRQSLLVTEAMPDAPTLLQWSKTHRDGEAVRDLRRRLAKNVAGMHEHGYFHRDLHGRNILVDETNGKPVPYFLDFHEMLRLPRPLNRFCVDDLARLNAFVEADLMQRARFARDYILERGMHPSRWRDWAKSVDRKTRELWTYYLGKGRDFRLYD